MTAIYALFSPLTLLIVLLLQAGGPTLAQSPAVASTPDSTDSNILVARGVLSRNGEADTLWILKSNDSVKFRDDAILQVTFTTQAGKPSQAYAVYDGKYVELAGEVKEVSHGNAILSKVRTIGILESPPLSPSFNLGAQLQNPRDSAANPDDHVAYKHAYYLFLASVPTGCQACYVPLLITQLSLEEIANGRVLVHGVFLFTYERDSIWEMRGAAPIDPTAIETAPRIIRVNGNSYRYQEISPREVLRLLENPGGTIAISRPMIMNKTVPGASLPELIADFRALQGDPRGRQN